MKLYIWHRADRATANYHDEGGVIAIAESLERARELIKPNTGKDEQDCSALTQVPDLVRECEGPEGVFVHPDAGCC